MENIPKCLCGHSQTYHVNGAGECNNRVNQMMEKCPCREFEETVKILSTRDIHKIIEDAIKKP